MHCKLLDHQIYIHTNGSYRFCCSSRDREEKETIHTHTPLEWFSSERMEKARQDFKNGVWPDACVRCKTEEELGIKSMRMDYNENTYKPGVNILDLRFSNSCNLKCISCWSGNSSSIAQEVIEMQEQGILDKTLNLIPYGKPLLNLYDEAFVKSFEDLPLTQLTLAGGEPMMMKHVPDILDRLDPSVKIRFTSNMTIFNPKLFSILKKFKRVSISASVDAIGKRIEYIRYGTDWATLVDNINRYQEVASMKIISCISVLNILYYPELQEWAKDNNLEIVNGLLQGPEWLNIQHAPEILKKQITVRDFDSWCNREVDITQHSEFMKNINRLDNFRKINIRDYLPEVAAAYGM